MLNSHKISMFVRSILIYAFNLLPLNSKLNKMKTKGILGIVALVFVTMMTIWVSASNKSEPNQANQIKIEYKQAANPAHCDPSNCTPEEAAKCPYANKAEMSATANATKDACPATKECPPSKCNSGAKSNNTSL